MSTATETPAPVSDAPGNGQATYQAIPVNQIVPSPHQARKDFDEEALKGLAESMRHEGLVEPIVLRRVQGQSFELISGERRLRAAKMLGWEKIEAKIISTVSEAEAAVKGLIENVQRQDLNPIEEAEAFAEVSKLDPAYWNQGKIGEVSGKGRVYVNKSLSLLTLPAEVVEGVRQRTLSREHGIEILRINNANSQKSIANKIIKGGWSVKQTREAILDQIEKSMSDDKVPGIPGNGGAAVDPLAELWPNLMYDAGMAGHGAWRVTFGLHKVIAGNVPPLPSWCFTVNAAGFDPRSELADWFEMMANALKRSAGTQVSDTSVPRVPVPRVPVTDVPSRATVAKFMPDGPEEVRRIMEEQKHRRFPQNAAERAEVEALALKGPGPVYAWIWGPDSFFAQKMSALTWQDLNASDPIKACRELMESK